MVGAGAVVTAATSELGEEEHDHIVAGVMLLQVVVEVHEGSGEVLPERFVHVDDAGAHVGEVHLGGAAEALTDGGVGVLDGGGILGGSGLEHVGALQDVGAGLA